MIPFSVFLQFFSCNSTIANVHMSVCPSVIKTHSPLKITYLSESQHISAYQSLCESPNMSPLPLSLSESLSDIIPISHHAHQPSRPSCQFRHYANQHHAPSLLVVQFAGDQSACGYLLTLDAPFKQGIRCTFYELKLYLRSTSQETRQI